MDSEEKVDCLNKDGLINYQTGGLENWFGQVLQREVWRVNKKQL